MILAMLCGPLCDLRAFVVALHINLDLHKNRHELHKNYGVRMPAKSGFRVGRYFSE